MADNSNRQPTGGWLLPLVPSEYFEDPENEIARLGALDPQFEGVREAFDDFLETKDVRLATGADLDALGALVGVARLAGESDTLYRARIPATAQHGVAACTNADMTGVLEAATGLPVQCFDGTTAGTFSVFVLGVPTQPKNVLPLIQQSKALGMIPSAFAVIPGNSRGGGGLAGGAFVGTTLVGGNTNLIALT